MVFVFRVYTFALFVHNQCGRYHEAGKLPWQETALFESGAKLWQRAHLSAGLHTMRQRLITTATSRVRSGAADGCQQSTPVRRLNLTDNKGQRAGRYEGSAEWLHRLFFEEFRRY